MWAGEFFLRLRIAYLETAEDQRRQYRLAAYMNYHFLASQGAKLGTFTDFLRNCGLTDEIRISAEEARLRSAKIDQAYEEYIERRLRAAGQREVERKADRNGTRRIPNPRRRRTRR